AANALLRGRKGEPLSDAPYASRAADRRGSMGRAVGDPDLDGDLDLFITHWKAEENALYRHEHGIVFRDVSPETYVGPPSRMFVGWACDFADLDCDGRPDLYVVNGSTFEEPDAPTQLVPMGLRLLWNGGRRFFERPAPAGAALLRPLVGRGGTAADLDGDGDLDLVVVAHGESPVLLRNETERRGGHLVVEVRGSAPNVFGYGARVLVEAGGRRQVQQVGTKVSYLSSGPHALHFGLGDAARADRVVVRFPSGRVVERRRVPAGSRLRLKEVDPRTLGARIDRARDALGRDRREEAARIYRELLLLDPLHPGALYGLAQLAEPAPALELCRRLLRVEPKAPRGHLLRARILSDPRRPDLLDLDEAQQEIARARRLNRDETGALYEEGRILLLKGEVRRAAEVLEQVGQNPRAAPLAALCRFRLGEADRARALLRRRGGAAKPGGVLEEGDTEERRMGARDPVAGLLELGEGARWRLVRLPVEERGGSSCSLEDVDGDGSLDARVGSRAVLLRGLDVKGVLELPEPTASAAPRLLPYSFEEAAAWALDPPDSCAGAPPGATALWEADVDGAGDPDLVVACGGDDPTAPLPWGLLPGGGARRGRPRR
ncbi:MAG: FG-GAP-like repeat-containing protein, partial [Planctomycetota bacterium]